MCTFPNSGLLNQARPQPAVGQLWAHAWFPEIVFWKVCVFVCLFVTTWANVRSDKSSEKSVLLVIIGHAIIANIAMSGLRHNLIDIIGVKWDSDVYLKQKLILLLLYPPLSDILLSLQSTNCSVFLLYILIYNNSVHTIVLFFFFFKIAAVLSIAHHSIAFKR